MRDVRKSLRTPKASSAPTAALCHDLAKRPPGRERCRGGNQENDEEGWRFFGDGVAGPWLYSAARASSAGLPECTKWLVPFVNAPGTMIDVSIPQRVSSLA